MNNMRSLIAVFDKLLPKTCFIQLPGDEIIEKKHGNIKMLTAAKESADLSKRTTRKWPGLGANVFEIDFGALSEAYKKPEIEGSAPPEMPINEITSEIEVKNTDHHKAIIKARNKYYQDFKVRFQASIKEVMVRYDELRKEEVRFTIYWNQNLNEITKKHI
jgi:hypothetical protein